MTQPTDFRANRQIQWALVQLLDGVKRHDLPGETGLPDEDCDRIWEAGQRARALLAAPQQGAPCEKDLETDFRLWWNDRYGQAYFGAAPLVSVLEWAQHLLTRCGAQTVPVPVEERLPGREDLDQNAYCWLWNGYSWERSNTIPMLPEGRCIYSHWLPHWALPLPKAQP